MKSGCTGLQTRRRVGPTRQVVGYNTFVDGGIVRVGERSLTDRERESELELSSDQKTEMDRCWAEHLANPESVIPGKQSAASCATGSDPQARLSRSGDERRL